MGRIWVDSDELAGNALVTSVECANDVDAHHLWHVGRSRFDFITEPVFLFSVDDAAIIRIETFNRAFLNAFDILPMDHGRAQRIALPSSFVSRLGAWLARKSNTRAGKFIAQIRTDHALRWWKYDLTSLPDDSKGRRIYAAYGQDITQHRQSARDIKMLSAKLLDVQDRERRRIARELHDSTAQHLVAIGIGLSRLDALMENTSGKSRAYRELIAEIRGSLAHAHTEIRTTSMLLHPPLPDGMHVAHALGSLVSGFAQRTGIRASLVIEPDVICRTPEMAVTIMRIAQEALTNIYRHAGATEIKIALRICEGNLTLDVDDNGCGFTGRNIAHPSVDIETMGVGIPGMRARLLQFRGDLTVRDSGSGICLRAVIPQSTMRRARPSGAQIRVG